jgi:hypothetical protein
MWGCFAESVHNVRRDALLYVVDKDYHTLRLAVIYSSDDADKIEKRKEFIERSVGEAMPKNNGSSLDTINSCFYFLYEPNMTPIASDVLFEQKIKDRIKEWQVKNASENR